MALIRRMRAIRQACTDAKTLSPEFIRLVQDPFLKASLGIRIAVFLGIVLLMAAKPELWASISVVGASVVLGVLFALLAWRRSEALPVPMANPGD